MPHLIPTRFTLLSGIVVMAACSGGEPARDLPVDMLEKHVPSPLEDPWYSTFSIVAFDPGTGEHGVAVASRPVAAGAAVPWAVAGLGAVATQAAANRTYGPKAMALFEQGLSPDEVIERITSEDPDRDRRQVAVIDRRGRTAVYTGRHVIDRNFDPDDIVHLGAYAGDIQRTNYSVQENTLASKNVLEAMASAYEGARDTGKTMAERLMDALDAGNGEGGDVRGMGSAGILVVQPVPDNPASIGRTVDLRVDHAEDPFVELRRILNKRLARPHARRSRELARRGAYAYALAEQKIAAELDPTTDAIQYGLAERYVRTGEYLNALLALGKAIELQPRYRREAPTNPNFERLKDFVEFHRLVERTP